MVDWNDIEYARKYRKKPKREKVPGMGRVPKISIKKVEVALKANFPKAMSLYSIILATTIKQNSAKRILNYLVELEKVEVIDTTRGKFYRWNKK